MAEIDKNQLRNRLIDCGYIESFAVDNTVQNLLNLKKLEDQRAYMMLEQWMQTGKLQKFEPIEGIDIKFLRNTLKMKEPAVILAYGMLLFDSKNNAIILKREAQRRQKFQPFKK